MIVLFFLVLFLIVIIFLFSLKIQINIDNLKISTEKHDGSIINKNFKIIIFLYIFNRLRIFKSIIDRNKLENLQLKNKIKKFNITKVEFSRFDKENIKKINKYKPKVKYADVILDIGIEDAALTAFVVAFISSILGILLNNTLQKTIGSKFIVNPIFANKNLLNLELNCIIELKLIHIIYIIYILNQKRRDDKNVRTSNRRSYGYSYE